MTHHTLLPVRVTWFGVLILAISLVLSCMPLVLHAGDGADIQLETVDCFDPGLYQFQSVEVIAGPAGSVSGETFVGNQQIEFSGTIKNKNNYPVVDGYVLARISKINPDGLNLGHDIVDELIVASNVVVDAESVIPLEFTWKVPPFLGTGEYRIDYFFSVGKKFNLGGLPFTNEIVSGFTTFTVSENIPTSFQFNRSATTVNGAAYPHIGEWPLFPLGDEVVVTQPITNFTDADIPVTVTYDLYRWDGLLASDLLDSKTEELTIPANGSIDASYTVSKTEKSVYYLHITAESRGVKSIVNVRFLSEVSEARINFAAVSKFPLQDGDQFKAFTCYHSTFAEMPGTNVTLKVTDRFGRDVVSGSQDITVDAQVSASVLDLFAQKNYTYLKLETVLSDKQGAVLDSYETEYDCNVLRSDLCSDLKKDMYTRQITILSLLSALFLAIFVMVYRLAKDGALRRILLVTSGILFVLSVSFLVILLIVKPNDTSAGVYVPNSYQSDNGGGNFTLGWTIKVGDDDRWVASGWVNRLTKGALYTPTGSTNLSVGDVIQVDVQSECTFHAAGGSWDTPACEDDQKMTVRDIVNGHDTGARGYVKVDKPTFTVNLTYNTSVLNCVLSTNTATQRTYNCTAIGPGQSNIQAAVSASSASIRACNETGSSVHYTSTNNQGLNPYCQRRDNTKADLGLWNGTKYQYGYNTVDVKAHTMSWNVSVGSNGSCGSANGTTVDTHPTGSAACSAGTFDQNSPADTIDQFKWSCNGTNGGTSATNCYANIAGEQPQNGACGSANGTTVSSQPTGSAACVSPSAYNQSPDDTSAEYRWTCLGVNGGSPSGTCSATKEDPNDPGGPGGPGGPGDPDPDDPPSVPEVEIDDGEENDPPQLFDYVEQGSTCTVRWSVGAVTSPGTCRIVDGAGNQVGSSIPYTAADDFTRQVVPGNLYTIRCVNSVSGAETITSTLNCRLISTPVEQ